MSRAGDRQPSCAMRRGGCETHNDEANLIVLRYQKERTCVGIPTQVRPPCRFIQARSGRDDCDDLQRARIDDYDLVLDEEVIESSILRNNPYDVFRQRENVHIPWDPRSDGNTEVHVPAEPRTVLAANDRFDLRALIF